MLRLLRNAGPYTLTKTWYVDGTATDVGAVTIGITDANGDTVVAAATATTNNNDGTYTYELANQYDLALLTVTWTRSDTSASITDTVEVVGNFLFTEAEARAAQITGQQTPLSSTSNYPDSLIQEWHDRIAEQFESKTGRSFIRRYCRMEFEGNGQYGLHVSTGVAVTSDGDEVGGPGRLDPRKVISVTVDGSTVAASNVKIRRGQFIRTDNVWSASTISTPLNVVIEYEYGDDPVKIEANEAALRHLLHNAVPSDLSYNAVSWSNEDGSFRRDATGWAYSTPVYEFLKRMDRRVPFA